MDSRSLLASLLAWLLEPTNYHSVIISFASALIIVLVINIVLIVRRLLRETKIVRGMLRHGNTVVLRRQLLLPLKTIEQGQSGVVLNVYDLPRLQTERQMYRRIAIVDFNGTLVPLDTSEARRYLVLEDK